MRKLRVNEIYASIQGEGPNTGQATTFIRFGGCNLRCPGWGYGEKFDGTKVAGCDTVHAVDPSWRSTWAKMAPTEIVDLCHTPMVTLTGGEPLIQPEDQLELLWQLLYNKGHTVDIFTNGTQLIPDWLLEKNESYIIMDFKLPGSGEFGKFDPLNFERLRIQDTIKFVCKDYDDVFTATELIEGFKKLTKAQFSMGVVWDQLELKESDVAEFLSNRSLEVSLNIQLHKHIWDPDERRR